MTATPAGRVLALLFLANLLNFYDRTMPGILVEEVREDFPLSDTQVGLAAAAFTIVYAAATVPLGRMADRTSRRRVMGWGLTGWSAATAATAAVTSFGGLLASRVAVGVGEAAYAPAAHSLIADLYPSDRRSRATAIFMMGLPLGLILSFLTVGAIAEVTGSWRWPFVIAAVPGFVLAVALARIIEPARGAQDAAQPAPEPGERPLRRLAGLPPLRWLALASVAHNVAAYAVGAFTVPLLQRHFDLGLAAAGALTALVVGVTGLVGLLVLGRVAERAARRSPAARAAFGATCLALAVPLTGLALQAEGTAVYAALFGTGWLLAHGFYPSFFPAISDVVAPRLRASAVAVVLGAGSLLGGAGGPLLVGVLSDRFAQRDAAGGPLTDALRGAGLHEAMGIVVPLSLVVAAAGMALAARTLRRAPA